MPSGDHTGPMGQGPMTGKLSGFCTGNDISGNSKGFRRGMGRGFCFGKGRKQGHAISGDDETNMLKSQAEHLKHCLKDIEKRLSELEKEGE